MSHDALDAHPKRRAADYLRAMLVAHGALPARDEPLVRLERAVAGLLAAVTIVRRATLYLRAAIALLAWLRTNNIRLDRLTQADIDQWLLIGPTTLRREVADFLG